MCDSVTLVTCHMTVTTVMSQSYMSQSQHCRLSHDIIPHGYLMAASCSPPVDMTHSMTHSMSQTVTHPMTHPMTQPMTQVLTQTMTHSMSQIVKQAVYLQVYK